MTNELIESLKPYCKKTSESVSEFNIISISGMERKETSVHSAFIAELLNPKGRHQMGSRYLNLFVEKLNKEGISKTSTLKPFNQFNTATVKCEYHNSFIDADNETGGRLDIIVEDLSQLLIIENKIDAGDQSSQLLRYYNFGSKYEDRFAILYLTLDGRPPTEYSYKNKEVLDKICRIDYQNFITEWLDECIQATDHADVKSVLNQYAYVVRKITNQIKTYTMETNIKETILKSEDNFKTAEAIAHQLPKIKEEIVENFWDEFDKKSKVVISNNEFTWKGFTIKAEILEDNDGAYLGFFALDSSGNVIKDHTAESLKPLSGILVKNGFKNNRNYIGWKYTAEFEKSGPASLSGTEIFQLTVEDNRSRIIKRLLDEYEMYIKIFREEAEKVESQI